AGRRSVLGSEGPHDLLPGIRLHAEHRRGPNQREPARADDPGRPRIRADALVRAGGGDGEHPDLQRRRPRAVDLEHRGGRGQPPSRPRRLERQPLPPPGPTGVPEGEPDDRSAYLAEPGPREGAGGEHPERPRPGGPRGRPVHARHLCYVGYESLTNPAIAESIASQTNATLIRLDPIEGLSLTDQALGMTYLLKMQDGFTKFALALNHVGCN